MSFVVLGSLWALGNAGALLAFQEPAGLFEKIHQHVKAEQALVSDFLHYPSVHSLYRQAPPQIRAH